VQSGVLVLKAGWKAGRLEACRAAKTRTRVPVDDGIEYNHFKAC